MATRGRRYGMNRGMKAAPTDEPLDVRSREVVGSYPTYPEAEAAVDTLSDEGFPVEHLAIVAEELAYVEDVTGRRTLKNALLSGLASGVVVGALLGFVFGLFDWVQPLVTALTLALYGVLIGGIIGGAFGALNHALMQGRHDFASIGTIRAERYVVVSDAEKAEEARSRLRSQAAIGGKG